MTSNVQERTKNSKKQVFDPFLGQTRLSDFPPPSLCYTVHYHGNIFYIPVQTYIHTYSIALPGHSLVLAFIFTSLSDNQRMRWFELLLEYWDKYRYLATSSCTKMVINKKQASHSPLHSFSLVCTVNITMRWSMEYPKQWYVQVYLDYFW